MAAIIFLDLFLHYFCGAFWIALQMLFLYCWVFQIVFALNVEDNAVTLRNEHHWAYQNKTETRDP